MQRGTTSTEFLEWQVKLERQAYERSLDHYYYAQIVAAIKGVWGRRVRITDYLLNFTHDESKRYEATTVEERGEASKRSWLGFLKVKVPEDE